MLKGILARQLATNDLAILTENFPYSSADTCTLDQLNNGNVMPELQPKQPNILQASFSNLRQFLICGTERYRKNADRHWGSLFGSANRVCLVCGSCGLALVIDVLTRFSLPCKLDILALGPVAFPRTAAHAASIPQVTIEALQGSRDLLSQVSYRLPCKRIRGLGHMGYWSHPEVREFACQWLFRKISGS